MQNEKNALSECTNEYGNVDVRGSLSSRLAWVDVPRASTTAKARGIAYAPALVGFREGRGGRYRPMLKGVVVAVEDEAPLRAALASRSRSPHSQEMRRQARQKREAKNFASRVLAAYPACGIEVAMTIAEHATEIGSGRVGRVTATDSDVDPVEAAVIAWVRHNYTSYDDLVGVVGRQEARSTVAHQVREIVEEMKQPIEE